MHQLAKAMSRSMAASKGSVLTSGISPRESAKDRKSRASSIQERATRTLRRRSLMRHRSLGRPDHPPPRKLPIAVLRSFLPSQRWVNPCEARTLVSHSRTPPSRGRAWPLVRVFPDGRDHRLGEKTEKEDQDELASSLGESHGLNSLTTTQRRSELIFAPVRVEVPNDALLNTESRPDDARVKPSTNRVGSRIFRSTERVLFHWY